MIAVLILQKIVETFAKFLVLLSLQRVWYFIKFKYKKKNILELRKDLDKTQKTEIYGFCVETIDLFNKENAEEE